MPYRFAFGLPDGTIKMWSIQSDMSSDYDNRDVELIDVHDRKSRDGDPRVSKGKCFTIMPPRESQDDQQELE